MDCIAVGFNPLRGNPADLPGFGLWLRLWALGFNPLRGNPADLRATELIPSRHRAVSIPYGAIRWIYNIDRLAYCGKC